MTQHISLYRKYRPDSWDKVIGQNHIVTTLINQINMDKISHAYLFTGSRGTGKTSSAKIFAKSLNCLAPINGSPCNKCKVCLALSEENNLDVIEMDAASNNSVDDIRDIREKLQFPPAIAKYRVYIVDEVHMLSSAAFNALLKTLEEPPNHIIFILATTEVHKLPKTILSRCMRFDFRLVSVEELTNHLASIFDAEQYKYEKKAIEKIAIYGEGSVRDTLSIADMCMSYAPINLKYDDVLEILGSSDVSVLYELAKAILTQEIGQILEITSSIYSKGKGIELFNKELSEFFRELISIKNITKYKSYLSPTDYSKAQKLVANVDNYRLVRILDILASSENIVRYSSQQSIVFDANLVKAAEMYTERSNEAYISRISALEKQIENTKEISSKNLINRINSLEEIINSNNISRKHCENISKNTIIPSSGTLYDSKFSSNTNLHLSSDSENVAKQKISTFPYAPNSNEEGIFPPEHFSNSNNSGGISPDTFSDSNKARVFPPDTFSDSNDKLSKISYDLNTGSENYQSISSQPQKGKIEEHSAINTAVDTTLPTPSAQHSAFFDTIARGPIQVNDSAPVWENALSETANNEKTEECPPNTNEHKRLMRRLLETILIKYGSDSFLYKTLTEIKDYCIQGNEIVFFTDKNSLIEIINRKTNIDKLEDALLEIEGRRYSCIARKNNVEKTSLRSKEQMDHLVDLFGDKLRKD